MIRSSRTLASLTSVLAPRTPVRVYSAPNMRTLATQVKLLLLIRAFGEARGRFVSEQIWIPTGSTNERTTSGGVFPGS